MDAKKRGVDKRCLARQSGPFRQPINFLQILARERGRMASGATSSRRGGLD